MKVSKEKMAEHREKILTSAAKQFRERGFDGISVADLMKEAGLTHGGFYGHFESKDELMALASRRAMSNSRMRWEQVVTEAPGDLLGAWAESYLSRRHRDNAGSGCLFAALAAEAPRQAQPVRAAITEGVKEALAFIKGLIPGRTELARRRKAIAALSTVMGAMVLARGVEDRQLSDEILEAGAAAVAAMGKTGA